MESSAQEVGKDAWEALLALEGEIASASDAAARGDALARLGDLAIELRSMREELAEPSLDAPEARATMTLIYHRALPPELDPRASCYRAIEHAPAAQRAGAGNLCSTFLYERGDAQGAIECVELVLAHAEDAFQHALLLFNLAQLQRRTGTWEEGYATLVEGLSISQSLEGPRRWIARGLLLGERTENLIGQGALNRARAALDEELDLVLGEGPPPGVEPDDRREVETQSLRHQVSYRLATSNFKGAYDIAADPGLEGVDEDLLAMRGIALGELGRAASVSRGKYFDRALEDLGAALARPGMTALEGLRTELARVEYALLDGRDADASAFLERAVERGAGIGTGLADLEYGALLLAAEARMALRRETSPEALTELDRRFRESFEAFLASWSKARSEHDLAYLRSNNRREVVGARMAFSINVLEDGEETAFRDLLRVQGHGAFANRAGRAVPTLGEVRSALLEDRHGILAYLPAPSGSLVFALDRERLLAVELAQGFELSRVCKALRAALEEAEPGGPGGRDELLARAIDEVSAVLLPPSVLERVARWDRLTVVGSEFLFGTPFECLRGPGTKDDPSAWLGETHAVDRLPTIPVGLLLAERPGADREAGMLVLVSEDPGVSARQERKLASFSATRARLSRLTAPYEPRVRIERNVTPSRLSALDCSEAAVVQFLAHGIYESSAERAGPALVLEPDGEELALLRYDDLSAMRFSGVVLLSACEAGDGPTYWGNDRGGDLGTACLEGGAPAVVLTGARVRYEDVLAFKELVVGALAGGASPAEAARRARATLGGPEAEVALRAQWARFGVLGLGQR